MSRKKIGVHQLLALMCMTLSVVLCWHAPRGYAESGTTPAGDRPGQHVTQEQREAAAARVAAQRAALRKANNTRQKIATLAAPALVPVPGGVPDYFGIYPNWAFSPPLRKFVDTLPGLGSEQQNNLQQYIPIAHPDTVSYPGSDYYELGLVEYTEQLHSDLPPTRLRGYVQLNKGTDAAGQNTIEPAPVHYLGPFIQAKANRPVRIKFTNLLPTGSKGDLFLPVDTSVMGAGMGPLGMDAMPMNYTQNRAVIHLHGGRTPWISDGTPHQWITPAGEMTPYRKGTSVQNVPDMPDPGEGSVTYFFTNQQSARLLFYHDHALGITRLNVYAGEVAGYEITDDTEKFLVENNIIPTEQIRLIIQDKTFVDANTIMSTDPTWNWGSTAPVPHTGDLWFPHVYMTAQNPADLSGLNAMGRWHYGPWFWPPTRGITHGPVPNPYYDPVNAPWEPSVIPGVPNVSMAGEAFMDTPLVNGTAFPTVTVQPKAYRFRILNGSDDRFWNLQLYEADSTVVSSDGRTNTEVKMVPAQETPGFPSDWPTDGRAGGVPDPATAGPEMIQIGTDSGFLPMPVVLPNQPIDWNKDQTAFTFGNVTSHTLLLAPAERAVVIIDFSKYAGKTLILYNDAPAAFPALDPRLDYYTGAPDMRDTGGHSGPQVGFGPNTRTIMQIRVADATPVPYDATPLESALPAAFAVSQDPIIIPNADYNAVYNKTFPADTFVRIHDTSKTFTTVDGTTLTIPLQPKAIQDEMGEAYDDYGRMSGKMGLELPNTSATNQSFVLQGFIDPPTEVLNDSMEPLSPVLGDGTQVWKITHNGVDTHPIHFHLFDVQLINRVGWDGAITPPDLNETGWKDTVRVSPLQDTIVAMRPVAPKVPFGVPDSIRPLDPTMPIGSTMGFTNIDPLTGQAITTPVTNQLFNFGWEYMWHCHILSHEEMEMMRPMVVNVARALPLAAAGLTAVRVNGQVQLSWTDGTPGDSSWGNPANEVGYLILRATNDGALESIGSALANATTYLDTTAQALTMYTYRVLAYNAAGSVQSQSVVVPGVPGAPTIGTAIAGDRQATVHFTAPAFDGGSAITQYTVTSAPGNITATGTASPIVVTGLTNGTAYTFTVTATNAVGMGPASQPSNAVTPYPPVPPSAPTSLTGALSAQPPRAAVLSWVDTAKTEEGFTLQRSTNRNFTQNLVSFPVGKDATSYADTTAQLNTPYYYRVRAYNSAGPSAWSNWVTISVTAPAAPSNLRATAQPSSSSPLPVSLSWRDNADNESGFIIQRATNSAFSRDLVSFTAAANATTFVDATALPNTRYYYRICATNVVGNSSWASSVTLMTPGLLPLAPTNLQVGTATRNSLTISWTDNANNEQGFYVERSPNGVNRWMRITTFTTNSKAAPSTVMYTNTGLSANTTYYYRVCAYNASGTTAYTSVVSGTTLR